MRFNPVVSIATTTYSNSSIKPAHNSFCTTIIVAVNAACTSTTITIAISVASISTTAAAAQTPAQRTKAVFG